MSKQKIFLGHQLNNYSQKNTTLKSRSGSEEYINTTSSYGWKINKHRGGPKPEFQPGYQDC